MSDLIRFANLARVIEIGEAIGRRFADLRVITAVRNGSRPVIFIGKPGSNQSIVLSVYDTTASDPLLLVLAEEGRSITYVCDNARSASIESNVYLSQLLDQSNAIASEEFMMSLNSDKHKTDRLEL